MVVGYHSFRKPPYTFQNMPLLLYTLMGQGTTSCLEFRFRKDVVLEFDFFVGGSKIDFNRVR